jgi:hypothetical protein
MVNKSQATTKRVKTSLNVKTFGSFRNREAEMPLVAKEQFRLLNLCCLTGQWIPKAVKTRDI